jgi:hypothetical protein
LPCTEEELSGERVGDFIVFLAFLELFWLFLVVFGCFWLFLVVFGCFWLFLVVFIKKERFFSFLKSQMIGNLGFLFLFKKDLKRI